MASVLVVDDDEEILDAVCAMLAGLGHVVERAAGGLPALEILDQGTPLDLLLTDVMMPGLNGFNLARMAMVRRPALKVLYCTANTELHAALQDEGLRFGKILRKPLLPDELKREVEEALARGGG